MQLRVTPETFHHGLLAEHRAVSTGGVHYRLYRLHDVTPGGFTARLVIDFDGKPPERPAVHHFTWGEGERQFLNPSARMLDLYDSAYSRPTTEDTP